MVAGAERTELACKGTGCTHELLGIDVYSHERVMTGPAAARDDLRHRTLHRRPTCNIAKTTSLTALKFHGGQDCARGPGRPLSPERIGGPAFLSFMARTCSRRDKRRG